MINKNTYKAKNIKYINDINHIRLRPSMYIGDTHSKGLHHLFHEIINNSIDEFTSGFCNKIYVKLYKNNSIKIKDNGRGIPVKYNKKYKINTLQLLLTKLGSGGKFNNKIYKMSSGLHGVGLSCVNALSKKFIIKIINNKNIYKQIYKYGKPITKIIKTLNVLKKSNGTIIHFLPDKKIFKNYKFKKKNIIKYLKEIAFLNKIYIYFIYKNNKKKIYFNNGIKDYFYYNYNKTKFINKTLYIIKKKKDIFLEIIFNYKNSLKHNIISFVNNIRTYEGGTHILGFIKGLNKILNFFFYKKQNSNKYKNIKITNKYYKLGLVAIINLRINNPKFESQIKNKLTNKKIINIIKNIIYKKLNLYFNVKNNLFVNRLFNKILIYYKYYQNIKKDKELLNKKKEFLNNNLPLKLSDCLFNKKYKSEIYLVEGDSAGGTAKQGRNRKFQAILPLKGKIINSEKSIPSKVLENKEIKNIFLSLGIYYNKKNINIKNIRYKKIIIMTDADVDGQHIITLLLTFFIKYLKDIIINKLLYIVYPPLYLIKYKNKNIYLWNKIQKKKIINKYSKKKIYIQRYKGLGEMNANQLWNTTLNPKNRILKRIIIKNFKKTKKLFNTLMGNNIKLRKLFINKYYKKANIYL
ncbi:MAG: toprim domain-containing protein [Candidatus Shikimatogenerans sp. AspAUS03]|uniref:DNA topoisomerase (ATP-hydrolyzing) n=1 Tax=Candidatus Shikimatogenerans sp. AspAUS03 TaxID=3158563 RepID=A0AAU7QSB3_9FLAO